MFIETAPHLLDITVQCFTEGRFHIGKEYPTENKGANGAKCKIQLSTTEAVCQFDILDHRHVLSQQGACHECELLEYETCVIKALAFYTLYIYNKRNNEKRHKYESF